MVLTLLGYLAARIPIDALARPRYLPPLSVTWDPYSILSVHKPFRATVIFFGLAAALLVLAFWWVQTRIS
jgi:hypothetical protein